MLRKRFLARLLIQLALPFSALGIWAQCPMQPDDDALMPPPPAAIVADSSTLQGEPLMPESGVLSNTVYTSRFFGFSIDLPIPLAGHRMILAPLPSGHYALLGIGFQQGGQSGTFIITAGSHVEVGRKETPQEKQEDFQRWAQGKLPQVSMEPPDWMQRSNQMKHVQKHQGSLYGAQYWTRIKNYTIRFTVETNDQDFLKRAKHRVQEIRFYCPQDDGTLLQADGKIVNPEGERYEGPSIPSDRIDAAVAEPSAGEAIPKGEVQEGVYRNAGLDLDYDLPPGWHVSNAPEVWDSKSMRASDLLKACSTTLLRLDSGSVSNDRTPDGTLVLRAIDQACLPLPMPVDQQDQLRSESLGEYLGMLGVLGNVNSRRLLVVSGRLFAIYQGTLAEKEKRESLQLRNVSTTVITRYRKLLLLWSWSAPSTQKADSIACTNARFGDTTALLCPAMSNASVAQAATQR